MEKEGKTDNKKREYSGMSIVDYYNNKAINDAKNKEQKKIKEQEKQNLISSLGLSQKIMINIHIKYHK